MYHFLLFLLFLEFNSIFYHFYRIDPIIAVVDWHKAASGSQFSSSKRSMKKNIIKVIVCKKFRAYGVPAINTWPVGRHLALLDKIIKDKIQSDKG